MTLDGRVRIEHDHDDTPGWASDDGVQYHQVIVDSSRKSVYRDALGRSHPTRMGCHRWLPLRCNNTDCGFAAIVNTDAIEETVAGWIDEATYRPPARRFPIDDL